MREPVLFYMHCRPEQMCGGVGWGPGVKGAPNTQGGGGGRAVKEEPSGNLEAEIPP